MIALVALWSTCLCGTAAAQGCINYDDYLHWVGHLDTYECSSVVISGGYAYLASGHLRVVDISDPRDPEIVNTVNMQSSCGGGNVVLSGGVLYYMGSCSGLRVLDLSDPESPAIVESSEELEGATDFVIVGDYLYAADQTDYNETTLYVIDMSSFEIVGSVETWGFSPTVAVSGTHAYVVRRGQIGWGMTTVDVSDPAAPTVIDDIGTADDVGVGGSVVHGTRAFVGAGDVYVIDITDPGDLQLLAQVDMEGSAGDVRISGDHLYVAGGGQGLQVIDISDPESYEIVGSVASFIGGSSLDVSGGHACVTGNVMNVINTVNPESHPEVGSVELPNLGLQSAGDVFVLGDYAYLAYGDEGLLVVDVSDRENPVHVATEETSSGGSWDSIDLVVMNSTAYLVGENLDVVDVTDPENPEFIRGIETDGLAYHVSGSNGLVYVLSQTLYPEGSLQIELSSRVVFELLGGALLHAIDELHSFDHLGQQLVAVQPPPSLLCAAA